MDSTDSDAKPVQTSNESLSYTEPDKTESKPSGELEQATEQNVVLIADSQQDEKQVEPPYSAFTEKEKISTILMVSFMGLISPLSSSIYFPALTSLADDLHVSVTMINLTITTYMIFQGLAPSFIGNFADTKGRRPAYLITFCIYLAANIGLALQNDYTALMILRCVQSSGSSGTIALAAATVADMVTRAERGKYIGYASLGMSLGPTLGPIIGGLLDTYLGWHSIFWFLVILSGVLLLVMVIFLPETGRAIVGNGSVPPAKWNMSLISYLQLRKQRKQGLQVDFETIKRPERRPLNPFATLQVARDREVLLILCYAAIHYAGYFAILSTLSTELASRYHLSSLHIGLCFIPLGLGSVASRWTLSFVLDRNFRRIARIAGIEIVKGRQQRLSQFPIEKARLQIAIPAIYASCAIIVAYSWVMQYKVSLAAPLVILFFAANVFSGVLSILNTLVVDLNTGSPATATAAMNLFRCLLGAGASGAAAPIINAIGIGWTGTMISGIWIVSSPMLWIVLKKGQSWRDEKRRKAEMAADLESRAGAGGTTDAAKT